MVSPRSVYLRRTVPTMLATTGPVWNPILMLIVPFGSRKSVGKERQLPDSHHAMTPKATATFRSLYDASNSDESCAAAQARQTAHSTSTQLGPTSTRSTKKQNGRSRALLGSSRSNNVALAARTDSRANLATLAVWSTW